MNCIDFINERFLEALFSEVIYTMIFLQTKTIGIFPDGIGKHSPEVKKSRRTFAAEFKRNREFVTKKRSKKGFKNMLIMKKMMILAAAVIATMSANAKSKAMETQRFDKVQVNVPAQVRMAQGEEYAVRFASTDGLSVMNVRYSIENGTLKINSDDLAMMEGRTDKLYITIITPEGAEMVKSSKTDFML